MKGIKIKLTTTPPPMLRASDYSFRLTSDGKVLIVE